MRIAARRSARIRTNTPASAGAWLISAHRAPSSPGVGSDRTRDRTMSAMSTTCERRGQVRFVDDVPTRKHGRSEVVAAHDDVTGSGQLTHRPVGCAPFAFQHPDVERDRQSPSVRGPCGGMRRPVRLRGRMRSQVAFGPGHHTPSGSRSMRASSASSRTSSALPVANTLQPV
jgi:hypothetical protein